MKKSGYNISMEYKLVKKRYIAAATETPTSREFPAGTMFEKVGVNSDGSIVFLRHNRVLYWIQKKTFRHYFELAWNDTSLLKG